MSGREVNMKDLSTAGWLISDNHSSTSLTWRKKTNKQERQKESLLAERNELSRKCFSNTALRPGSMSKNGYVTRRVDLVTFEAPSHHKNGDCLIQIQFYNFRSRKRKKSRSYHSATTNAGLHNGLRKASRPFADLRPTVKLLSVLFLNDNISDMAPTCSCEGQVYKQAYCKLHWRSLFLSD